MMARPPTTGPRKPRKTAPLSVTVIPSMSSPFSYSQEGLDVAVPHHEIAQAAGAVERKVVSCLLDVPTMVLTRPSRHRLDPDMICESGGESPAVFGRTLQCEPQIQSHLLSLTERDSISASGGLAFSASCLRPEKMCLSEYDSFRQ